MNKLKIHNVPVRIAELAARFGTTRRHRKQTLGRLRPQRLMWDGINHIMDDLRSAQHPIDRRVGFIAMILCLVASCYVGAMVTFAAVLSATACLM